jgi:hypothetical protein
MERPSDGLSELPLAVSWRALRPSKPPNRNKSKNFPNEGWGGLAVVAVHELSWPCQQQSRNTPSRPANEAGQGSDPKTLLKLPTRLQGSTPQTAKIVR